MNLFQIIILVVVILLISIFSYLVFLGLFKKVEITESPKGPYYMVYKKMQGSYSGIGNIFSYVKKHLDEKEISVLAYTGVYYDDPGEVPKDQLKSEGGFAVSKEVYDQLPFLSKDIEKKMIQKQDYITAEFPYKNMLSVFLSLVKVYPKMGKHYTSKGYKKPSYVLEVTPDPKKSKTAVNTLFLMQIIK